MKTISKKKQKKKGGWTRNVTKHQHSYLSIAIGNREPDQQVKLHQEAVYWAVLEVKPLA